MKLSMYRKQVFFKRNYVLHIIMHTQITNQNELLSIMSASSKPPKSPSGLFSSSTNRGVIFTRAETNIPNIRIRSFLNEYSFE